MKYEAINHNSSLYSVRKMCRVLGLNPSNYYRWIKNEETRKKRLEEERALVRQVEEIFRGSDKTYGYRAIKKALEEKEIELSEYRIRRIMRENGMYPETRTKYKPMHNGKVNGRYYRNLLQQNFRTEKKNQVWVGDITYIKTNAIRMKGTAEGLIFHSDRGCQYASKSYQKTLQEHGIQGSMSRPGCPYDNSCMESFFATLKKERIYRREYDTIKDVERDLFRYIELFYNRKRLHSVLGYMSPVAYRLKYDGKEVA